MFKEAIAWLKRIFSVTTLSIMISVVGLYYSIKTYFDNLPEQATIEFSLFDWDRYLFVSEDVTETTDYWMINIYDCPIISNYPDLCGPQNTLTLPRICNNTKESLKDFSYTVYIHFDKTMEKHAAYVVDTQEYDIIRKDSGYIHLKYKNKTLPPHTVLPMPILYDFTKMDENGYTTLEDSGCVVTYEYDIVYDGVDDRIAINFYHRFFYNKNATQTYINQKVLSFLKDDIFVKDAWQLEQEKNDKWAIVVNGLIYKNIKHFSQEDFSKFHYTKVEDLQQS